MKRSEKRPQWPVITNLRADPFESASRDSGMYVRWYADNMWLMVPAQGFVQKFFEHDSGLSVPAWWLFKRQQYWLRHSGKTESAGRPQDADGQSVRN